MAYRILCPTDGSDHALSGVDCAIDLAKSTGATVTFLAIEVEPRGRFVRPGYWDGHAVPAVDTAAGAGLWPAVRKATARDFGDYDCIIAHANDAAAAIAAYADAERYQHIVMGAGVANFWQRLLGGSVAIEVVDQAHCPVTVVH